MKFLSKRDIWALLFGVLLMQVLSCGLVNQFMFHPVKDGYDKSIISREGQTHRCVME